MLNQQQEAIAIPVRVATGATRINANNQDEQGHGEISEDDTDLEKEAETTCYVYGKIKRENGGSGCLDFCWLSDSHPAPTEINELWPSKHYNITFQTSSHEALFTPKQSIPG